MRLIATRSALASIVQVHTHMLAQTLGWIATFLFTVCYIPQIAKTIRSKTLSGLSVSLFIIQIVANIDALAYAILIDQRPLQIKYTLALIMLSLVLFTIYRIYAASSRTKHGSSAPTGTLSALGHHGD